MNETSLANFSNEQTNRPRSSKLIIIKKEYSFLAKKKNRIFSIKKKDAHQINNFQELCDCHEISKKKKTN